MSGEVAKISPVKLRMPDAAPRSEVGEGMILAPELSDRTIQSTLEMAKQTAEGKRPSKRQVESFVADIAKDLEKDGKPVGKENVRAVAERLNQPPIPDVLPEDVQLPSFDEIKKTLDYVERMYATPEVRNKIKAAGYSMMGLELVMGAGQYAWQEFLEKAIGDRDQVAMYSDLLNNWMNRKSTPHFNKQSFFKDIALKTAGLWAPPVVDLLSNQAIMAANKSLNGALEVVGNKINQRTTESLLLQKYAFIQDIPPTEVMAIIERGKFATTDLIVALRADAYPGMARIVSNLIPAFQINWLASLVGLGRLGPLYTSAVRHVKELMTSRGKMYSEVDVIDARIASLLSNLEIAQASGKSDEVARQLQEAMRMREELYGKQRMKKTEREGKEKFWHFIFDKAAPMVVTATEGLSAYRDIVQPILEVENARIAKEKEPKWIQPDFYDPHHNQFSLESQRWKQSDFFKSVDKANPKTAKDTEFIRRLSEGYIRAGALSIMKSQQFKGLQMDTAGEMSRLTSIYANNLIPDLQDIAEMEKLLGPWDLLDKPDGPLEKKRIPASALSNVDISVKNLSVLGILRDVSFDIKQGEFVAIRAQKGEGKTTLLRAMLGLSQPEQGSVSYGGVQIDGIKKFGPEALHSKFGYSPQSAGLIDTMTLKENLLLWNKDIPEEKLIGTMNDLGLEKLVPRLGETGNHFSGGEKRLLSIVRSLLTNPKILFLDEPTANLDIGSIDKLVATLQAIRKSHPETTIITVTHDEDFAQHTDRTISLGELNKKPTNEAAPSLRDNQVFEAKANANKS